MLVAANRWSADGEPGQETWITVLYLEREGGREGGRGRGREGERERGWVVVVGGGCYLPWLWLLIDGPPMGRKPGALCCTCRERERGERECVCRQLDWHQLRYLGHTVGVCHTNMREPLARQCLSKSSGNDVIGKQNL